MYEGEKLFDPRSLSPVPSPALRNGTNIQSACLRMPLHAIYLNNDYCILVWVCMSVYLV
jgi:hypothetical protein